MEIFFPERFKYFYIGNYPKVHITGEILGMASNETPEVRPRDQLVGIPQLSPRHQEGGGWQRGCHGLLSQRRNGW